MGFVICGRVLGDGGAAYKNKKNKRPTDTVGTGLSSVYVNATSIPFGDDKPQNTVGRLLGKPVRYVSGFVYFSSSRIKTNTELC